jgi:hypothetical protein
MEFSDQPPDLPYGANVEGNDAHGEYGGHNEAVEPQGADAPLSSYDLEELPLYSEVDGALLSTEISDQAQQPPEGVQELLGIGEPLTTEPIIESDRRIVNIVLTGAAKNAEQIGRFRPHVQRLWNEVKALEAQPSPNQQELVTKQTMHWRMMGVINSLTVDTRDMYGEGRYELWRDGEKLDGHMVGSSNLADAVRLSPPDDYYEAQAARDARIVAARGLSDQIIGGQPAVIGLVDEGYATYSADTPYHDGFSIGYERQGSLDEKQLTVGVGRQTNILLSSIWRPDTDQIEPAIVVHSGQEAVTEYLTNECTSYVAGVIAIDQQLQAFPKVNRLRPGEYSPERGRLTNERSLANHNLAAAINAGEAVDVQLPLGDTRPQAMTVLRTYVLEMGDGFGEQRLLAAQLDQLVHVGHALQAIYPPDAPQSLSDYIIEGSLELSQTIENGHMLQPVIDLLHELCGMDRHAAFERLDPFNYGDG